MEKRQAIELLEYLRQDRNLEGTIYGDALNMAIEALKAQLSKEGTTKGAISRQAVIDALKRFKPEIIPYEKARIYVEETVETMYDRIVELPTIQPEPPWISVRERLPEEYGEYLVTKRIIGWNCEEYDVNDIAYFDDDGFPKSDRVIAWMPLPEAYKPNK